MRSYRYSREQEFMFDLVGRGVGQGTEIYCKDTSNIE